MTPSRREYTSVLIRSAARDELTAIGPRALSLSTVAKRAFVSVGSVYERYDNKEACVADLCHEMLPNAIDDVARGWVAANRDIASVVQQDLTSPTQLDTIRFIAECVFAARDDEELRPVVVAELRRLIMSIGSRNIISGAGEATAWWIVSTWLGYALLQTSGCVVPGSFVVQTSNLLGAIGSYAARMDIVEIPGLRKDSPAPATVDDPTGDTTTSSLLDATRRVIAEQGVDEANTRAIAREAGVTTGAIYRRFPGRSQILARAFITQLPPERYAWTQPLLEVLDTRGLEGSAAFFIGLVKRIWEDEFSARMLLEFTVAAHTDEQVLQAILHEIGKVAQTREELFTELMDAGVIRHDVSAEALSWLLQIPPIGMRLLASVGIVPSDQDLSLLVHAYLLYLTDAHQ